MSERQLVRIGTRGSPLARWQAEWVAAKLAADGHAVELVQIQTRGDVQTSGPVETIGGLGVFTKELQHTLLDDLIDIAVHSLKDLPTEPVSGLSLLAVPSRWPAGDVLISKNGATLDALPQGATVATGSLRRRAQLLNRRGDLRMAAIRGNVDTRIRKLHECNADALVLAEAGIVRLGLESVISERLSLEWMLPAVGQGALGIEGRSDDKRIRELLAPLDHFPTHQAVLAERALLAELRGGCLAPVGAFAHFDKQESLVLRAAVLSSDGGQRVQAEGRDSTGASTALGQRIARELISQGANALIEQSRTQAP